MFNKKEYMKKYNIKWWKNNPEYMKQYRENNPEYDKNYYLRNIEKVKERCKKWNKDNPDYKKEHYKNNLVKWEIKDKKKKKIYQKEWFKNNPEKAKIYRKLRTKKSNLDPKLNLNRKVSMMIRNSLKGNKNGKHWEGLVGYTLKDLIKRLSETIPKSYTWGDYLMSNLHIDHILPIRLFQFKKPEDEEFKQCWDLHNLRLLTKKDNLSKNDSINNPILLGLLLKDVI